MAAHAEHAAQVVLAKHKNIPKKFVALKVVYLRSPDMLQEPEHLAIMKRYMSPLQAFARWRDSGCSDNTIPACC